MSTTRLLSPFCVLSCNQSSSLFSGLLCRFRYSPVECPSNKFYGINCHPKLGTKLLDRFFHRRRQVSPPVNRLTHRFFDGSQHFLYCNFTVGSRHSAVASSFSRKPLSTAYSKTAALLDLLGNISARDVFEVHGCRPYGRPALSIQQSLYWHERRSTLVLDQEHQEFRRIGTACVPVNDMNIVRAFIEGLSWCQCYLLSTLQLHHNGAIQYVNKRMCIVSVDRARPARRMLYRDHQNFPAGILQKILRHQRRDLRLLSHRRAGHQA